LPGVAGSLDGGRIILRRVDFVDRLESGTARRLAAMPEPVTIPLGRLLLAKET
jgi:hypothetical protein